MQTVNRVSSKDGTRIAFDRAGSGPAIILVDPAGAYRGFGPMPALAEELASAFTVITYDRRGRGESEDTPPYAVEREIDDIEALIDTSGGSAFVHGFSSGAVLALWAAESGLPISKLSLLEAPLEFDATVREEETLGDEIAALVAAGRRGDAVEHFNRSIGVPEEYLVGMRDAPWWPAFEAMAHTLVYDTKVTGTFPIERLPSITTPTLLVTSEQTDGYLRGASDRIAAELPNATRRTLPGEWHGVAAEVLAPVLREFLLAD